MLQKINFWPWLKEHFLPGLSQILFADSLKSTTRRGQKVAASCREIRLEYADEGSGLCWKSPDHSSMGDVGEMSGLSIKYRSLCKNLSSKGITVMKITSLAVSSPTLGGIQEATSIRVPRLSNRYLDNGYIGYRLLEVGGAFNRFYKPFTLWVPSLLLLYC